MKDAFAAAFDQRRVIGMMVMVGVFFLALIVRLYLLQVVRGDQYVEKSESNFVQERRVAHARGLIVDQKGTVLVDNRPSHDVYMTVSFLPDSVASLKKLLEGLGLTRSDIDDLDKRVLAAVEERGTVIIRDVLEAQACKDAEARAKKNDVRGVVVEWAIDDQTCQLAVDAAEFPSRASVFRRLRELLGLEPNEMKEYVQKAMQKASGLGRFKQTLLLEDIPFEAYARIEAAAAIGELPGIDVNDSQKRRYREGTRLAHVLGFMNELAPAELAQRKVDGYRLGDLVGRRGVEAVYESTLRGIDGTRKVVVDAKGRDKGDHLAEELLAGERLKAPVPGHTLVLAIDDDLQRTAEEQFGGLAGSVVALEVKTGFVLAMASFPTYDPNSITGPRAGDAKVKLDKDPNRPWINKATENHYAPGSTFKTITAAAGLKNALITTDQNRHCPGFFRLGRSAWRCFNRGGHGQIALVKALQYSCDTYFYSLGYDLGPDRLAETARLFGFGAKSGIDLDREAPGINPDREYYVRRLGAYTPGLVVNNSIGQGDVAVTPLQLALSYAAVANGGTVYRPQVVREIRAADGSLVEAKEPVVDHEIELPAELFATVKEALSHVTEAGGTASGLLWRQDHPETSEWLRNSGVKLVGKTGTAQVVKLSKAVQHVDAKDVTYLERDHAWFVAFAPQTDPEIVVVTMTEHGGFGGSTSGPVTAEVMHNWFTAVRGTGRYGDLAPLPVPKRAPAPAGAVATPPTPPTPKPGDAATNEEAPSAAQPGPVTTEPSHGN